MMPDATTIAAVFALVGVIAREVVTWRRAPSEMRRTNVEADVAISAEARQLLAELRAERDNMRAEIRALRSELATAELRILKLERWVRAQGHDPLSIYDDPEGHPV